MGAVLAAEEEEGEAKELEEEEEGDWREAERSGRRRAGGYDSELPIVTRVWRMHSRSRAAPRSAFSRWEIRKLLCIGQYILQISCHIMNNFTRMIMHSIE